MSVTCARCELETPKAYACEHTGNAELCKECYQQVHWDLTNKRSLESA